MVQSGGVRLSIWAPAAAPLTASEAADRSALRPTSTADSITGWPDGTGPPEVGTIVRTIGGEATADGDAIADGLAPMPGEGAACTCASGEGVERECSRNASLAVSVGGTPGGVGPSLPGTAPRTGRSFAGAQAAAVSTPPPPSQA